MKITDINSLQKVRESGLKKIIPVNPRIAVGMGTCGIGNGAEELYRAFEKVFKKKNAKVRIVKTGCFGFCAEEPLVNVYIPGKPLIILHRVILKDIPAIAGWVAGGKIPRKKVLCRIEMWDHITGNIIYGRGMDEIPLWNQIPFFKAQKKVVLRNCGLINPEDIKEYIAVGGYSSLCKVIRGDTSEKIINEIKTSGLRGRGGAGFPTGKKWELMKQAAGDEKYVICNADEGDPGAYMNRNEIESDPHSLIEGMLIGAFATGATGGIIYIRAEYPLAVKRVRKAVKDARDCGFIGKNILNSDFDFEINIVEGAGAFVCGEETALISSLEGKPGKPRPRPPFPAQKGFKGKPTNINNVETWYNIPVIISKGGEWFKKTGSKGSPGTKVFSLVGKVKNTGLVELPLGSSLQTLVYNIGGGNGSKKIKAVQTGGPSGGCIPVRLFDTPVDYESLASLGAIMGSGGMVVMDEDDCMVDVARYFVEFTTHESCGKCVPCREGLYRAMKIIKSITAGTGLVEDIPELENLGGVIKDTALCGLGQTGPNPVLTTLRYFRDEYEQHLKEGLCIAGVCGDLFLSPCENSCPLHMDIPCFIELLKEGRIEDAFLSVLQDNPLPSVTGRICHHPCENRCRRTEVDDAVSQREIHRYIADTVYKKNMDRVVLNKLKKEKFPSSGRNIAIIGSGPAGLTAAFYLVRLGHNVTVYEKEKQPGGMLRATIPCYRLPKQEVDREIGNIKRLGVKFIFGTQIGRNVPLKKLEKTYDAVFVSVGAQKEIPLGIPGENLKGVMPGTGFLKNTSGHGRSLKNKKTVVIGGGNAAIDAARTAVRFGADVTVAYRREKKDMPANIEEIREAETEGIKFIFFSGPEKITGINGKVGAMELMRMTPGEFDSSGRRRPVPSGETYRIPCEAVIIAVGEKVDSAFFKKHGIKVKKNGSIETDPFTLQTNARKFYAGGDAVLGPATVTEAMASGKKFAELIDLRLTGKKRFQDLFREFTITVKAPSKPLGGKRHLCPHIPVKKRINNFKEITEGFSRSQAEKEALRCLRCDIKT